MRKYEQYKANKSNDIFYLEYTTFIINELNTNIDEICAHLNTISLQPIEINDVRYIVFKYLFINKMPTDTLYYNGKIIGKLQQDNID